VTGAFWRRLAIIFVAALGVSFASDAVAETPRVSLDRQILVMIRHPPDHYRASGAYGGGYGDELGRSGRLRIARDVARKYGLALMEDWPMPTIGIDCFVMAVREGRSTSAAADEVSHDSKVAWAQPVELYGAQGSAASHNDPLFPAEPAASQWHLADLHHIADGRVTRVAVIDSGIDARHPDLAGQVAVNRNFVAGQSLIAEQHGTAVAGIIAAKADNHIGIAGVAPGTRLLGLRACWQSSAAASTICDTLSLAKALYFAVESHADVINLSLSGPANRLLGELVAVALDRKQAVVSAFDPKLPGGGFPASLAGVIAVSDSSLAGQRADVYIAPGQGVPTTEPGGRWFLVNGSSFAAAHVSGLVALTRERRRSAPLILVSQRHGGGQIDACATLMRARGACDCECGSSRFGVAGMHR